MRARTWGAFCSQPKKTFSSMCVQGRTMLVVYQRGKKKFAQGATLTSAGSGVSGERVEAGAG